MVHADHAQAGLEGVSPWWHSTSSSTYALDLTAASRWSNGRRGNFLCLVHRWVGSVYWEKEMNSCHIIVIQYWSSRTEWGESSQWTELWLGYLVVWFVWEERWPAIWIYIYRLLGREQIVWLVGQGHETSKIGRLEICRWTDKSGYKGIHPSGDAQ